MAALNFNAAAVEPSSGDFTPVPAGWYPVQITESEMKQTKACDGHYLEMVAKVINGDAMNRQFYIRLNLDNKNEVAVRIANEQLSAICHAVNVLQCETSEQLHGIPFDLKVVIKAAADGYEASNEVKGFRALEGAAPAAGGPASGEPSWANGSDTAEATKPAPKAKPAPAAKAAKTLEMIDTDYTYEEWQATGRNDQEMVDEGIAKWVELAPAKKAPPAKKAAPAKAQSNTSAADGGTIGEMPADVADSDLPPWMQE